MADIICFEEYQRLKIVRPMPEGFMPERPEAHLERQGTLDGLCGVYCIINAVSRLALLSISSREALFKRLVKALNADKRVANYLLNGTSDKQLRLLLKEARSWLKREYDMNMAVMPLFSPNCRVGMEHYLKRVQAFTQHDYGVVVAGLEGIYQHWTCVTAVTEKTIRLLDSDGLNHLRIAACRISKKSLPEYHCLHPSMTWGLRLDL